MRILYITLENLSLHKGSVVHINEVVKGLQKLGHQICLIGYSSGQFEGVADFLNLYKFPWMKRQSYFLSSIFLFCYLLKILPRYDIIYARDYHTVLIALLPRMIFKKRMIYEINGLANEELKMRKGLVLSRIFSFLVYWAEGVATKYSDKVIAVTPQIALYLEDHFVCSAGKIEVISNGVNMEIFYPIKNRNMVLSKREKLGIGQEETVLAFVGNLAPWQGVEDLIRVAPLLLEYMKNIRFLIVGDGILKKDFEAEVKRLQLSYYFIFTGMVSYNEIPLYINISDVCVVLKRRLISGYSPIKLYEYMACGKPIVATRVGGFEFIEKEGIGQLIEPGDIVNLREVLRDFLGNPHKRIVMGLKSQKIAKEGFSWDSRVNSIEKILKELA